MAPGRGNVAPTQWRTYLKAVAEAARKPRRGRPGPPSNPIDPALGPKALHGNGPPPQERRCQYSNREGRQCRKWAMRGATRCFAHGGCRQVPDHPASIRLYHNGRITANDARRRASAIIYSKHHKAGRAAVMTAQRSLPYELSREAIADGILSYYADDAGKAWRQWLDQIKKYGAKSNA